MLYLQRQLDSLSTFVRQRLRSTGQRATITSDSGHVSTITAAASAAAVQDGRSADDGGEHRGGPSGGVESAPATAAATHDAAQ